MTKEDCHRVDSETRESGNARQRVNEFERQCPTGLCERFSFENGSSGIVSDSELVVRMHFSPRDVDADGNLLPLAFSDVQTVGLSVIRSQATDDEFLHAARKRLANLPDHSLVMVSTAVAREVRSIMYSGGNNLAAAKCFAIYDTAETDIPNHAEVMQIRASRSDRLKLRELFIQRQDESFRNQLFNISKLRVGVE